MAHDLRSPIVGITNLARLLFKMETSEDKQNYLHLMENSGNHALNIILDLLDMENLEHDKEFFELRIYRAKLFIQNCIKYTKYNLKIKKIQILLKAL